VIRTAKPVNIKGALEKTGEMNMVLFPWEKRYETGIDKIDEQHKELVRIINGLHEAMKQGEGRSAIEGALKDLKDYTIYHFDTEEELMSKYGYPSFDEHRRQHEFFRARINEHLKNYLEGDYMVTIDLSDFLREWLSSHILGSDKEFAPFLRSRGEV
jgi:hemerythrin-like metal-binding protein